MQNILSDDNKKEQQNEKKVVIVNRLKQRMKELGINARQLAEQSNVGRSFVYDILNGKSKNPTSNKLNMICEKLNIPISYLLNENNCISNTNNYYAIHSLNNDSNNNIDMLINKSIVPFINPSQKNINLFYYRISDDSMEPIIKFNSILIFNKQYNYINNGIFLIKDKIGVISIRRIESKIGTKNIIIIPENKRYAQYESTLDNLKIIGEICFKISQI